MSFDLLLSCYLSGQMSERQWQAHLEDREFAFWVHSPGKVDEGRRASFMALPTRR